MQASLARPTAAPEPFRWADCSVRLKQMDKRMRYEPENQPTPKLSQMIQRDTTVSSAGVEQDTNLRPELIFRSPLFSQRSTYFAILWIVPVFVSILEIAKAILTGNKQEILVSLALVGVGFVSIGVVVMLETGQIVLKSHKLVEYRCLGFSRTFLYSQIYAVKQGARADLTWIGYYPFSRNGCVDYERRRGTVLIPIQLQEELRHELSQRITAPTPTVNQGRARATLILLLLFMLVIFVVIMVLIQLYPRELVRFLR
jgi:hypothetical protein